MPRADLDKALAAFDRSGEFRRATTQLLPVLLPHSQATPALARSGPPARGNRAQSRNPSQGSWRKYAWSAATMLAAVPLVAWWQPWSSAHSDSSAADDHAPPARVVNVTRPELMAESSVALPATIRPWQTAALHARVSGYLVAWHADLGKQVKGGEVLATIDTPELDQELAQSVAQAQESLAAVAQAKAERQEAESDLQVAEAQLVRAKAEAVLAQSQLVRREKLRLAKAIPQEEYDAALRQVEARAAEVAAAEADVARRRTNLETRASIIEAREATAKSSESNAQRLRELQAFKQIVAPFDGVVTRRQAEVGALVTAGGEPLFVIDDVSRVRVQTNVPQAYAAQTREAALAKVSVPESTSGSEAATITRTSESVDPHSRTLLAEIELENSDRRFKPGSYAQVILTTKQSESSWTVPSGALLMRVEGSFVAAVDSQDQVTLRPVRLGRDFGRRVAVLEGITGRERLVVNPTDDLHGTMVSISANQAQTHEVAKR